MQDESAETTIGKRLRRLLGLRGQSIREFSDATGIAYRTLQDYLADKGKPGAEQLARIANVGLDVNFVLTGKSKRLGYPLDDEAPADDELFFILADPEVREAIDSKAKEAVTRVLSEHLREGDELTFNQLLDTYLRLFGILANIFARSKPPIGEARKLGLSADSMIASILDASAHIAAAKVMGQTTRRR